MNLILVVACALIDVDNRVLIAQRPEGKTLAGLWEFPGGKFEPGERPEQALIRELHEELGIRGRPRTRERRFAGVAIVGDLRPAGSGCRHRPADDRAAGASRPSSAWAGECR